MLLETLDVRKNDILVYSENNFDFENNFKIIYKNEAIKKPRKISYFQICEIIKDANPKNLIVYRMLTNVKDLDSFSTKYGYFITIGGKMELIYFDPVFAIQDLKNLRFKLNPENFRFKIQQVGLTSLTKKDSEANFAETFHFDMHADEAQNQNDKIYADAIFALDEGYAENLELPEIDEKVDDKGMYSLNNIAEDNKAPDSKRINSPEINDKEKSIDVREENINLLKKALGITKEESPLEKEIKVVEKKKTRSFGDFIDKHKSSTVEEKFKETNVLDLFKSASGKPKDSKMRDEDVVLKFKSK